MRKLVIKTCFFILPFFLLFILNVLFLKRNEGDLIWLGNFYHNASPKSNLKNKGNYPIKFKRISDKDLSRKSNYDLFIFGDSFSNLGKQSYTNLLAQDGTTVLLMNNDVAYPALSSIAGLINGDFFDTIQVKYFIFQAVEREFIQRSQDVDFLKTYSVEEIRKKLALNLKEEIQEAKTETKSSPNYPSFFSKSTLDFPRLNILYKFKENILSPPVYKVATATKELFTGSPDHLLLYDDDINNLKFKNDSTKIKYSVEALNQINDLFSKKGIQFIVLISPDKYDVYYPYIKNKTDFQQSIFFSYYRSIPKNYIDINAFDILSKAVKEKRDIYYYDDTHWSPIGADIISKEIKKSIDK